VAAREENCVNVFVHANAAQHCVQDASQLITGCLSGQKKNNQLALVLKIVPVNVNQ
jgi:formylmethanofuran dehydrogenase subunit E